MEYMHTALVIFVLWGTALTQENVNVDISSCSLTCGQRTQIRTPASRQGIPGKRGPQGENGLTGRKGEKGDSCQCFLQTRDDVNEIKKQITSLHSMRPACPQTAYTFTRSNQIADFIRFKTPLPTLSEVSICMWAKSLGAGRFAGTLVSYSTATQPNTLVLLYESGGVIHSIIHDEAKSTSNPLNSGNEHHICMVMVTSRSKRNVILYYNGTESSKLTYSNDAPIPSGGAFLIGQEQDSYLGSFQTVQAFGGVIRNYMIWNRELSASEIRSMSEDKCHCVEDFIAALTVDQVQLEGGVNAMHVDQCASA